MMVMVVVEDKVGCLYSALIRIGGVDDGWESAVE